MDFDPVSYLMGKASGGGGGGGSGMTAITPQYQGYSYAYVNGADGTFIVGGSKETYMNAVDVEAGKTYVFFVGQTVGNRFRPSFFAGVSFDDWAQYFTSPGSITSGGQYLLPGGDPGSGTHTERIYFTPDSDGLLLVGTSNDGTPAKAVFLVSE